MPRHWWLMPVILDIWEAKIRRLMGQGQPGQKIHKTLLNRKKLGMVACAYHPSYSGKPKIVG
jgi:hypothetical protein